MGTLGARTFCGVVEWWIVEGKRRERGWRTYVALLGWRMCKCYRGCEEGCTSWFGLRIRDRYRTGSEPVVESLAVMLVLTGD